NRATSPGIKQAMAEGLASTGMNVTDIGAVLTPTLYFASASYSGKGAGVMITGSHLDTRYNGIKMAYGALALAADHIIARIKIIQIDALTTGQDEINTDPQMIYKHMDTIESKVKINRP